MTVEALPLLQPSSARVAEIEDRYESELTLCYQCKRCTAGCPVADVMDIRPHQIVRLARLGASDRLLRSEAIWTCVGCYTCSARCPQGVPITDLIHSLKGLAIKRGIPSKRAVVPAFLKAFEATVNRHGRNRELLTLTRYFLSTDPRAALKEAAMGLTLFRQARLPLLGEKLRGKKGIKAMLRKARRSEESPS
ncbi:MAG: 4Fe-4S dicluster domain-containing protein [Dehalococcoidia bacterium]